MAMFVAMIFDGLDGRVARLTGTETAFGKEYDSLADMVAFGLAPAVVCYQWGVVRIAEYGDEWGRFGWLAAFFYAAAAALRLARFNARSATAGQALLRRPAEPVGRRDRRRLRRFSRTSSTSPGCPGLVLAFASRCSPRADGEQVPLPQLQGPRDRRARALLELLLVPLAIALIASDPADRAVRSCSASTRCRARVGWSWLKLRARARATAVRRARAARAHAGAAARGRSHALGVDGATCRAPRAAAGAAPVAAAAGRIPAGTSSPRTVRELPPVRALRDAHADRVRRRRPQRAAGWSSARRRAPRRTARASRSSAARAAAQLRCCGPSA